ncbi:extracellular solute-binding protein [Dactylosporangium aurantiacum]|uniref:Extracellular solute-binding protein n=1 Tax=Dactylosporangium aurantiacum TaxID=35754 RepID=A0A9Q9MRR5_9ACTN|nr:extracellular solute-binding protein [Dactylosporangium aurantiacum]MDG6107637.1 extracellular solute-binding protein [Dactylosporangium aurantiacum]UWZ58767.1 extracellular solute-binding protein [Dactylosporangium aurantiacum]
MSASSPTRRQLLTVIGLGAGAAALAPLTACTSSPRTTANSAKANAGAALPTYTAYTGVTPDLPGNAETGVDPGFRHFPRTNPRAVADKPGTGQTVTAMANIYTAVPPGTDRNSYWRGLNDRLGVNLQLQMVPNADYEQKFATTIAGGAVPDIMQLWPGANFPALLNAKFARLDDFLAGGNIAAYPNLANIPTMYWKSCVFNGGIQALPIPRGRIRHYAFVRPDLVERTGLSGEPKGWEEFLALCKALTDPKQRRWALGSVVPTMYFLARMNEEPNVWRLDGGALVHAYETEQFKQSVRDMAELWKAGVVHPDAFNPSAPFKQYFYTGAVAMNLGDGYGAWLQNANDNQKNPAFRQALMPVYTRSGAALAPWHTGTGVFNLVGISKQDDPERIRLLLRVLNWLASPFGTEEYRYRVYGEKGVDHTENADGDPILTTQGATNTTVPVRYLAEAPPALYQPGRPDDVDYQHAYQSKVLANRRDDPTLGLYSDAFATKYPAANRVFVSTRDDVIQGRKPFSALDDAIRTFRTAVGDAMRKEYEQQLQQAGGPR